MKRNKKTCFIGLVLSSVIAMLLLGTWLIPTQERVFAQEDPTVDSVATSVALTLTAFLNLDTPTLSFEEQVEATVRATLFRTVWIEHPFAEEHYTAQGQPMAQIPFEIRAVDRESAQLVVVIEATEIEANPVNVSGCPGGQIERVQVDFTITLTDMADQTEVILELEGHVPRIGMIVYSCDTRHGAPSFTDVYHWLAPYAYRIATPTLTPTYTPLPTRTPPPTTPTETPTPQIPTPHRPQETIATPTSTS